MAEAMVYAEQTFATGGSVELKSESPTDSFGVVFEEKGRQAHFYAVTDIDADDGVLDTLFIYDATEVASRRIPAAASIVWSADGKKSLLLINDHPHAVFDFDAQRGYCRTNHPKPSGDWSQQGHGWSDKALRFFQ